VVLGTLLLVFLGIEALLLTMLVPFFIAMAIGSYLFYAQHNFPDVSFSDNAGWTYEKAALTSSSYMQMNGVMAWFTANIGYHHVHHLNSRIPFYRLPEVMKALPEMQEVKTTSLHPVDIWRCLRLKVWDVDQQRMVGLEASEPAPESEPTTRRAGLPTKQAADADRGGSPVLQRLQTVQELDERR
jgi:omega-6 fatty acid desaturase (delta-12 desaturase)